MRIITTFFFSLLILLTGCTTQENETDNLPLRTVICGKILNRDVYPSTKEFHTEVKDFGNHRIAITDTLNTDGTFKIVFNLYAAQDVKITPVIGKVLVHPGDSVHIMIDFNDIGKLWFTGDRAETNSALQKYLWSNEGEVSFFKGHATGIEAYNSYCDSILTDATKKQRMFIQKENPPPEVIQWTNDLIKINYYISIFSYPFSYYSRNIDGFNRWCDSTGYYDFMNDLDVDFFKTGSCIINTDVYKLLDSYIDISAFYVYNTEHSDTALLIENVINYIKENTSNKILRQMALSRIFQKILSGNDISTFENNRKYLNENSAISNLNKSLTDNYNNTKKHIKNPEIVSDAILFEMGVNGRQMLDSIIKENIGKVLYIDIWATWCGPCLEGMAYSKNLKKKFANKNVEFVYLCVGSKKEDWIATLSRLKIGGKHYFCSQEQSKDIRSAFQVNGIPHYVFVDKNGCIVDINAPGPQSQAIEIKFKQMLSK